MKNPTPRRRNRALTLALAVATMAAAAAPAALAQDAQQDAQSWKPAGDRIMSKFAGDLNPATPLPEYPRPQMKRDAWTNLNGLWDYAVTSRDADAAPTSWDGKILVPFAIESALSGVGKRVSPRQALWYHTAFASPEADANGRVLLHFGGVDWDTTVYVNGTRVGNHKGGFDPFGFDVTDALRDSGDNELVLRVYDPTDEGAQPTGKQRLTPEHIWYTPVTGIWQTVWMEVVPQRYISTLTIRPSVDDGEVVVEPVVEGGSGDVTVTVMDGTTEIGSATGSGSITVKVPDAKLWSPDSPHLYDLKVSLAGGEGDDAVESYFGMRKIEVMKDAAGTPRLALNGEITFMYGPLDQGWWPDGLYTAPTDAALEYDIQITKDMGFNTARKHTKTEPARWYYHADKLGLLVWQDMPTSGHKGIGPGTPQDSTWDKALADQFLQEWEQVMGDLYNHPSIVVWVPFNEGWGQHNSSETIEWTMKKDPSRLTDGPSGWEDRGVGDMKDMHAYPGPGMFPAMSDRVSVLGEFGGLGLPIENHLWDATGRNWGYRQMDGQQQLEQDYTTMVTRLKPLVRRGLAAAIYTQTTDVEGEVNGLLTYDRKIVKIDADKLKELHAPLYEKVTPVEMVTVMPTSEKEAQTWSYTFQLPGSDAWTKADYDASDWRQGKAGFGTPETPNTTVRTRWDTNDIWLRRTFRYDGATLTEPTLRVYHDEDATVYLNGQKVAELSGYTNGYSEVPVKMPANLLKDGENVIAVHCRQQEGGQYIDVGLVDFQPVE